MTDLLAALCLVLVIEGLLPLAFPRAWKSMVRQIAEVDERTIRIVALTSVISGLLLLRWVRSSIG